MALPTIEAATEFLTSLGDTPDEVAASIRALGIREPAGLGVNLSVVHNCVIALALKHRFPELNDDTNWSVANWAVGTTLKIDRDHIPLPAAVRGFIQQIDGDRYKLRYSYSDRPIKYRDLLAE